MCYLLTIGMPKENKHKIPSTFDKLYIVEHPNKSIISVMKAMECFQVNDGMCSCSLYKEMEHHSETKNESIMNFSDEVMELLEFLFQSVRKLTVLVHDYSGDFNEERVVIVDQVKMESNMLSRTNIQEDVLYIVNNVVEHWNK